MFLPMLTLPDFGLLVLAALAAGFVNALAGGGTLITFPMLNAVGVSTVVSNVTNTVALCPGYFGATLAQRDALRDQKKRLWLLVPISALGGIIGGVLLLHTGEKLFNNLVPYLILLASALLALQGPMRNWLTRRAQQQAQPQGSSSHFWEALPVGLATIYGGYFGAGMSVIILAVLGLAVDDSLTHLNALKQVIALSTNLAAAIFFIFSGHVLWPAAIVMAVGALIGGALGGKLAGRIKPSTLRWVVVTIGVIVSIIYFVK
jgi:uncharacterized membrane protein YfcA